MFLLIDVDGVLQFGRPDNEGYMQSLGWVGRYSDFLEVLFADEAYRQTLVGKGDIRAVLERVLRNSGQNVTAQTMMQAWSVHGLEINRPLLAILPELPVRSVRLASNQDPLRGAEIRDFYLAEPGVDGAYLSFEVGQRKPFAAFFEHILHDLDCEPREVVFVDDAVENVAMAAELGMHGLHFTNNATLLSDLAALHITPRRRKE